MKSKKFNYFKYFSLFFAMIVLVLVAGCTGAPPAVPIINSFLANPLTITAGESSNLSWSVTDATTVTIDNGIGSVALSGTTTVTPVTTTTYTLTATNSTGSVTASVTVTVGAAYGSIDINSNPVGAKVYLDGVDTGSVTPIILSSVTVGEHTIKLVLYHYKYWESSVTVVAGETTYLNPPLVNASIETIILQPGAEGKDAYVVSTFLNTNWDYSYTWVGNWGSEIERTYIQFDLSTVPAGAVVDDADLKLYQYNSVGSGSFIVGLYQVISGWEESNVTWSNQPDSSTEAEASRNIYTSTTWRNWDIDDLVKSWLDGSITNYGMLLKATNEASINMKAAFRTSDYTIDTTKRPKLEIDYYIP